MRLQLHIEQKFTKHKVVNIGSGSVFASSIIVGEAMGKREEEACGNFVGRSGQLLRGTLFGLGINSSNSFFTNTVPFRPQNNNAPQQQDIDAFLPILMQIIDIIAPKAILCVGKVAESALHNKVNLCTTFKCFHPAFILRRPSFKTAFEQQLKEFASFVHN